MNDKEREEYQRLVQMVEAEESRRMKAETQVSQMSAFQGDKEPNIIEYQLDVSPTLDRIYHLLSGHIPKRVNGKETWVEPEDDRLKILSKYGVDQIMGILATIINPNTLLSDFDDKQIEDNTRSFGIEFADLLFQRYEDFFYYPTPEELFEKYLPIFREKKYTFTEEELYKKCVQWSHEELKMKFRHYNMIVELVVGQVYATYRRARDGRERTSLRKQYNIHESINNWPGGVPNIKKR